MFRDYFRQGKTATMFNRFHFLSRTAQTAGTVLIFVGLISPAFGAFALDTNFDGDGRLTIAFPNPPSTTYSSQALRVFVQPGGRILVGGTFTRSTTDGNLPGIVWAGLTSSGALDSGFGSNGIVEDWRSDGLISFSDALMYADGTTLRLSQLLRLPSGSRGAMSVRLSPNGGIDSGYGQNAAGTINPCFGGFCAIQPIQIAARGDGKILAFIVDNAYSLYRLNADGSRDVTFGTNGAVELRFNKFTPTIFVEMITLPDGKLLVVGHLPGSGEYFLARLTETGNWDKLFGRVGVVRVPFGPGITGSVRKALLQPDGKILLVGSVLESDTDFWMARFRSNGRLDSTFGNNGVVTTDFAPGATDVATSVALSADGKIRVVGSLGSPTNFLVARFSSSGVLEESITFPFTSNEFADAADIALQADGKIVVVGRTRHPNPALSSGSVFAIARLAE